ncbi:hypothetical protein [Leucobacter sp. M11]|uniref:hypothetical protein n=1 Tax=Leucobacter sp. M11 TaxID=2993565 RepID=UPI002D7F8439|nr:hypothetical protein [Leucobacter sp. M11]MEB4614037.1 hypothetical protein [Leucobacter sp. M11]
MDSSAREADYLRLVTHDNAPGVGHVAALSAVLTELQEQDDSENKTALLEAIDDAYRSQRWTVR